MEDECHDIAHDLDHLQHMAKEDETVVSFTKKTF